MGFLSLNYDRNSKTTTQCILCGSQMSLGIPRPVEAICVICRAAILDRIFKARRRGTTFSPLPERR